MAKQTQPRQVRTKMATTTTAAVSFNEPVRSFCSRVITLCANVQDAMKLTYLQGLKDEARRLMNEAKVVQSVYGGHPREDLKKAATPSQVEVSRRPKKSGRSR